MAVSILLPWVILPAIGTTERFPHLPVHMYSLTMEASPLRSYLDKHILELSNMDSDENTHTAKDTCTEPHPSVPPVRPS